MIDHDVPVDITDFLADLRRQELAEKTITSYRADVLGFAAGKR
jgi:hypothetical protein